MQSVLIELIKSDYFEDDWVEMKVKPIYYNTRFKLVFSKTVDITILEEIRKIKIYGLSWLGSHRKGDKEIEIMSHHLNTIEHNQILQLLQLIKDCKSVDIVSSSVCKH